MPWLGETGQSPAKNGTVLNPSTYNWLLVHQDKNGQTIQNIFNTLRDHGVIQGYLIVEFSNPIADTNKQNTADAIDDLCMPIALYLSFQIRRSPNQTISINSLDEVRDSGGAQLTGRQLSILRGMVEGKTNHELATEMGFSVSTIRHETMRIYQALSVSDRKEAAKKAIMLSLV